MANSFIDRLFPGVELKILDSQLPPHLSPTFDPKQVLSPAFDPTLVLASQGTEPATTTSLAKDDSKFSGDADAVVVATIKETISNLKSCISAEKYDDALQCIWILRNLVCGYADFKCGVICALKDSKK